MSATVTFAKQAANVFLHVLTQCNLRCRHCYINPQQHGTSRVSVETAQKWLGQLIDRSPKANLVLLGGEPTLHPQLADIVAIGKQLGFTSITIDTNGFLFHDILDRVSPDAVDFFSFSLDGPDARRNDALRGAGSFAACTAGIARAKAKGFQTSLIFTVSQMNIDDLAAMPNLLMRLPVDRFFIQVIGLRGEARDKSQMQLDSSHWLERIPPVARQVAAQGIAVTYPKVYLAEGEAFECAGRVADNYFVFPNGRAYRCPLCEDFPLHSLAFVDDRLTAMPAINETDLFGLTIAEGCVMNQLIQPGNMQYTPEGRPLYRIACCLLKKHIPKAISDTEQTKKDCQ